MSYTTIDYQWVLFIHINLCKTATAAIHCFMLYDLLSKTIAMFNPFLKKKKRCQYIFACMSYT